MNDMNDKNDQNEKLPNPDPTEPLDQALGHDHDHDHDHAGGHHHHDDPLHPHVGAEVDTEELDPAGRSLAEALRVSFNVLKLVMIGLLIAFVLSGTKTVDEGTMAVRLLFGAVQGVRGEQVLEPGGPYFWPPEPIGEFIEVPTTLRQVTLDEAFWFAGDNQLTAMDQMQGRPLVPGIDGSLVTADQSIVHGKWTVNYRIRDKAGAVDFIRNVSSDSDPVMMQRRADQIVRFAAERAIVHAVAQVPAEEFVRSGIAGDRIRAIIQEELDRLGTGLSVRQVNLAQATPPLAVRDAFQAVTQAESQKATAIENARQEASMILHEAAGSGYRQLLDAIDEYERARLAGDAAAVEEADAAIADLLRVGTTQGEVSRLIRTAQLYKRNTQSEVRAEAEQFQQLLPEYQANPEIVLSRRWQATVERILSGDVETFYMPANDQKEVYLEVNRDPRIQRERERERLRAEQQQQQEAAQRQGQRSGRRPGPPGR